VRLTREQVGHLAQHVVRGLIQEDLVVAEQPDQLTDLVVQVVTADLEAEDRLNEEVREILKNYADEISRGMVNYQELFRKVKAKLARERRIVI
jgi:hypothetical protein